jgi:hypothetical protein
MQKMCKLEHLAHFGLAISQVIPLLAQWVHGSWTAGTESFFALVTVLGNKSGGFVVEEDIGAMERSDRSPW